MIRLEFEIVKPYLLWSMIVLVTFIGIYLSTTDISRKLLQQRIKKVFPFVDGPLTHEQIKLITKKVEYDLKVLTKDLKEWQHIRNERKITECKILITNIKEIYYLTNYKLLTYEQIRSINEYMLSYQPIWKKTEVPYKNIA